MWISTLGSLNNTNDDHLLEGNIWHQTFTNFYKGLQLAIFDSKSVCIYGHHVGIAMSVMLQNLDALRVQLLCRHLLLRWMVRSCRLHRHSRSSLKQLSSDCGYRARFADTCPHDLCYCSRGFASIRHFWIKTGHWGTKKNLKGCEIERHWRDLLWMLMRSLSLLFWYQVLRVM